MSLSPAAPLSSLGQAALDYARRGWPVFPCRERTETITTHGGKTRELKAKAPYGGSGVKDATTDEEVIKGWWRRWPNAMIGLAMGRNGLFALDFDPRFDEETGEVFDLPGLKAALIEQMGCDLPKSLTAMTQSGGVHVYLLQPDDGGEPIRNRGNLPLHVDVRGLGGYVIAPPSILYAEDGSERLYRWLTNRHDAPVEAPAALVEILRSKGRKAERVAPEQAREPEPRRTMSGDDAVDAARRKWALAALDAAIAELGRARQGERGQTLNRVGFRMGQLVGAGVISRALVLAGLEEGANACGLSGVDGIEAVRANAARAVRDGEGTPRDMSDVGQAAGRPNSSSRSGSRLSSSPPSSDENGKPASRAGGQGSNMPEKGAQEGAGDDLTLECARYPMTDLGNLERFLARHGRDFLCVASWAESAKSPGYIAWDGKRWNRSMADALFGLAAQATIRAIQDEAEFIRQSGVPFPPEEGDLPAPDGEDDNPDQAAAEADDPTYAETLFLKAEEKRKARRSQIWYLQRNLARQSRHDGPRHDFIVQVKSNGDIVLYSDKLAAWGRTAESSGHIECLRTLAPPRLSARPEDFDADPLALNVQNGTLVFTRPEDGKAASVELRPHRREDRITKLARAAYEPGATCPQYDAFIAQMQPADDMRSWLACWSGYNALGIADAQVMALFYGEGSNGKGVWVQTHAHILGDYAWATGIETFIDTGFKRNGGGPSPHLAALAGRRMVYANEPDDNSKFSDGLVKSLTSDEPIGGVRELYGPAFELLITFTNTVMANNLPRIGTDWGIRRRMQVVPWNVIIAKDDQDLRLKDKLRAEISGILNKMIEGALEYLTNGLTMPEAMIEATKAYHDDNDLLGQFLAMCVARAPGETVGSTMLHELFAAWQTWSENLPQTGKPWSAKKLRHEMERKSFLINKSSTMKWQDIVLRFEPLDFVDEHDKPITRDLPTPRHADKPSAALPIGASAPVPEMVPPSPLPPPDLDDDYVPGFD